MKFSFTLILTAFMTLFGYYQPDRDPEMIGGLDSLYKFVTYPESARKHNIKGSVDLDCVVDEKGKVGNIKVRRSLGYGCDDIVIQALKKMKFIPAYSYEAKKNIRSYVVLRISFPPSIYWEKRKEEEALKQKIFGKSKT